MVTNRETGFEYKLSFKADIVGKEIGKRMRLDKFIKEHGQRTSEIFGYEPFLAGSIPKLLVKKNSSKTTGGITPGRTRRRWNAR